MSRPFQAVFDDIQAGVDACNWFRMQISGLQVQDTREAQDGVRRELAKLLRLNLEVSFSQKIVISFCITFMLSVFRGHLFLVFLLVKDDTSQHHQPNRFVGVSSRRGTKLWASLSSFISRDPGSQRSP